MRTSTAFIALAFVALATGCVSPPLAADARAPEALRSIRAAFEATVRAAKADPEVRWVSGWDGNAQIEKDAKRHRGLCWEWQELVFAGVEPTARAVGWRAVRININRTIFSEHHAVLVYDPRSTSEDRLLEDPTPEAFVLDAWQRGEADVYTLVDWLDIPVIVFHPAELEKP